MLLCYSAAFSVPDWLDSYESKGDKEKHFGICDLYFFH